MIITIILSIIIVSILQNIFYPQILLLAILYTLVVGIFILLVFICISKILARINILLA